MTKSRDRISKFRIALNRVLLEWLNKWQAAMHDRRFWQKGHGYKN